MNEIIPVLEKPGWQKITQLIGHDPYTGYFKGKLNGYLRSIEHGFQFLAQLEGGSLLLQIAPDPFLVEFILVPIRNPETDDQYWKILPNNLDGGCEVEVSPAGTLLLCCGDSRFVIPQRVSSHELSAQLGDEDKLIFQILPPT